VSLQNVSFLETLAAFRADERTDIRMVLLVLLHQGLRRESGAACFAREREALVDFRMRVKSSSGGALLTAFFAVETDTAVNVGVSIEMRLGYETFAANLANVPFVIVMSEFMRPERRWPEKSFRA